MPYSHELCRPIVPSYTFLSSTGQITPLPVKELKAGNYYRDILTQARIRVTEIDGHTVAFLDQEGSKDFMMVQEAQGRFYDDGTIAQ
jgi:hypothetical protein